MKGHHKQEKDAQGNNMQEDLIVIDSDDYAAAGIETMTFPGGEPHVKLPRFEGPTLFFAKLRDWADVGFAALVIDGVESQQREAPFEVFVPYFPGARQDRTDGSAPFTLRVMARLVGLGSNIHVFDPHSAVLQRYTRARAWGWTDLDLLVQEPAVGVIAPDGGAVGRADAYRRHFHPGAHLVVGSKCRDSRTGALSDYSVPPLQDSGHYVIVDDICDGGGTFNLLMESVLEDPLAADSTFELVVSHGIFSKGLSNLHPRIERITTTDSWCSFRYEPRLTVVKLESLFDKIMGEG